MTQVDRYAVMGNPISHSKSPLIHTEFAKQTGQTLHYEAILVSTQTGEFAQAVSTFFHAGGKGLNVTLPFKQSAYILTDFRTARAERAGAVNTLWFDNHGRCFGDNTDGIGLVTDLKKNHHCYLKKQRVLLLGAGGAIRGILEPLLNEEPAQCTIANRTLSKAQVLTGMFSMQGNVTACAYNALVGQTFDVIINGTSASLQGEIPPIPDKLLAKEGYCYDMMYADQPTPFVRWGLAQGASLATDGLGMLVEQAAQSFYLWRQVMPDTLPVIQQLRAQQNTRPLEVGGPTGLEPTRYGDWEKKGRCIDF